MTTDKLTAEERAARRHFRAAKINPFASLDTINLGRVLRALDRLAPDPADEKDGGE